MRYTSKQPKQQTIPILVDDDIPQSKVMQNKYGEWWILEPPRFAFWDIIGDLRSLWKKEFHNTPWYQKLAFSILRIIQQVAYRRGYGTDRVVAQIPLASHPDFSIMEKNLEEIPSGSRITWLHTFLGYINNPDKAKNIELPSSIIFELSNTCNYNCIGCGIGKNGIQSDRFMDIENLRRWASRCCQNTKLIRINGLGEATLHPRFRECLDILVNYPGGREIITNGSAPLEVYERLLKDGFVILISWDAAEAELFEKIRRGANFATLYLKLPHIAAKAKQYKAPAPVLLFTFREQNMHQLQQTLCLAAESDIKRITVNMFKQPDNTDWTLLYRQQIKEIFKKAEQTAKQLDLELRLPHHLGNEKIDSISCHVGLTKCPFPDEQVVIRYNGAITPCNMMNPYVYGNIMQNDFATIWNGPTAHAFRQFSGNQQHPYCLYCYYVYAHNTRIAEERQNITT